MLLYKSPFLTVNYLEVSFLMHFKFEPEAKNLDDNALKAEMLNFYDKMVKRKGRLIFFDCRDIQDKCNLMIISWIGQTILPLIKSVKARKVAFIPMTELSQASNDDLEIKSFEKSDQAMQWLLENAQRKKLSFENGRTPSHKHRHR